MENIVTRNSKFITNLIAIESRTSKWTYKNKFSKQIVDEESLEYNEIRCQLPRYCKIQTVERIENPELMASFILKRQELEEQAKISCKIKTMFHATNFDSCEKIIKEGFDWRKAKIDCRLGRGIYLSPYSRCVLKFTKPENGENICSMLMCWVLIGKSCYGSSKHVLPPNGYDTTKRKHPYENVVVKFHDFTVYPAYLITFEFTKCVQKRKNPPKQSKAPRTKRKTEATSLKKRPRTQEQILKDFRKKQK